MFPESNLRSRTAQSILYFGSLYFLILAQTGELENKESLALFWGGLGAALVLTSSILQEGKIWQRVLFGMLDAGLYVSVCVLLAFEWHKIPID
ncbi:MAG: hypothetical protein ABL973_03820 [Micropepsaceae bacterium]